MEDDLIANITISKNNWTCDTNEIVKEESLDEPITEETPEDDLHNLLDQLLGENANATNNGTSDTDRAIENVKEEALDEPMTEETPEDDLHNMLDQLLGNKPRQSIILKSEPCNEEPPPPPSFHFENPKLRSSLVAPEATTTTVRVATEHEFPPPTQFEEQEHKPNVNNLLDELLNDPEAERIAEIEDLQEEVKYSEQLERIQEEINQLDSDNDDKDRSGKKHKKKHKKKHSKSHKRSRKDDDDMNPKRRRSNSPASNPMITVVVPKTHSPPTNGLNCHSAQDEVNLAFDRATAALQVLEYMEYQGSTEDPFGEFNYTPIMLRPPDAQPKINQSSVLLYSFQSNVLFDDQNYDASISFRMPQRTVDMARALGLDAQRINEKLDALNSWPPLEKKIENALKSLNTPKEVRDVKIHQTEIVPLSDDFKAISHTFAEPDVCRIQTNADGYADKVPTESMPHVQRLKQMSSIGTQVNFTNSESGFFGAVKNLPMMKLLPAFNEHQLLALNDFAELISTTDRVSNAMDLYCIRQRLMDIYNSSQMISIVYPNKK